MLWWRSGGVTRAAAVMAMLAVAKGSVTIGEADGATPPHQKTANWQTRHGSNAGYTPVKLVVAKMAKMAALPVCARSGNVAMWQCYSLYTS
jgi:hypothetical protein